MDSDMELFGVPSDVYVSPPLSPNPTSPNVHNWIASFQTFNDASRMHALRSLVDELSMPECRFMNRLLYPLFKRDFISDLPREVSYYILSMLSGKDLGRVAQVCSRWRILVQDNLLWREKCREENVEENLLFLTRMRQRRAMPYQSSYKFLYSVKQTIANNWRHGRHSSLKVYSKFAPCGKTLSCHDHHVITCLMYDGILIVSGSDDYTLKIWSASSGKLLRTLKGHTGGVWAAQMNQTVVVSASTDRTVRVWGTVRGNCLRVLTGHSSTVRCLALNDKRVVSGSRDMTLRIWNYENGECLQELIGHGAAVRCVCFDGKSVVSGAYDDLVKVWDAASGDCIHTFSGHLSRVYTLQFSAPYVISGSLDTDIMVWNIETGQRERVLSGHQSLTSATPPEPVFAAPGMELRGKTLVSGNADSSVRIWNLSTGECTVAYVQPNEPGSSAAIAQSHSSAVTSLQLVHNYIVSSSDDGTVKLWDLKTGRHIRDLVRLDYGGDGAVVWRIKADSTRLVCAVGSRNQVERTRLLVYDFDSLTLRDQPEVRQPPSKRRCPLPASVDDAKLLRSIASEEAENEPELAFFGTNRHHAAGDDRSRISRSASEHIPDTSASSPSAPIDHVPHLQHQSALETMAAEADPQECSQDILNKVAHPLLERLTSLTSSSEQSDIDATMSSVAPSIDEVTSVPPVPSCATSSTTLSTNMSAAVTGGFPSRGLLQPGDRNRVAKHEHIQLR